MTNSSLSVWQQEARVELESWALKFKDQLASRFNELCEADEITNGMFVEALQICQSMTRPSRFSFAPNAHFDRNSYDQWLKSENLPEPALRKPTLEIVWLTANAREYDDVEKMVYAIGYDFDLPRRSIVPVHSIKVPVQEVAQDDSFATLFEQSITELDLSVRSENCLKNEGIEYVGHMVDYTESQLLRIWGFGRISLDEVKKILSMHRVRLGMGRQHFPSLAQFLQQHPPLKDEEQR